MSSASIAVYRIQAACFVGRGDGKLAQRVREFQQLRGLGMLRDNRVGVIECLSRSIGSKRRVLSVGVTVNSRSVLENFSSCADLECCETIEWE